MISKINLFSRNINNTINLQKYDLLMINLLALFSFNYISILSMFYTNNQILKNVENFNQKHNSKYLFLIMLNFLYYFYLLLPVYLYINYQMIIQTLVISYYFVYKKVEIYKIPNSSFIETISYIPCDSRLFIEFQNKKIYYWDNISRKYFDQLKPINGKSTGKEYNKLKRQHILTDYSSKIFNNENNKCINFMNLF